MLTRSICTTATCLIPGSVLFAQEALQTAVSGDRALQNRRQALAENAYTVQAGPVGFTASAGLDVEWGDNIAYTAEGRESDFIFRPVADLDLYWPVTAVSTLHVGVGVGYAKYVDHTEIDYFFMRPDSAIAYSIGLGDFTFTISEQVSYSEEVQSVGEITGRATYPRLDNTAGLRVSWQPDRWFAAAGYSHYNFWAMEDTYDYLTRSSEQFFARGGYQVADRTRAGIEASVSLSNYELEIRSDYNTYSVGPFVEWAIVDPLTLGLRGGYVIYTFDDTRPAGPGLPPGPDQFDSYYAGLNLRHQATAFISQYVDVQHNVSVGIESSYTESTRIGYGFGWQATEALHCGAGVFWEDVQRPAGESSDEYQRIGVDAEVFYALTERIRPSLRFRHSTRNSDDATRDYTENVVSLGVRYRF